MSMLCAYIEPPTTGYQAIGLVWNINATSPIAGMMTYIRPTSIFLDLIFENSWPPLQGQSNKIVCLSNICNDAPSSFRVRMHLDQCSSIVSCYVWNLPEWLTCTFVTYACAPAFGPLILTSGYKLKWSHHAINIRGCWFGHSSTMQFLYSFQARCIGYTRQYIENQSSDLHIDGECVRFTNDIILFQ